MTELAAFKSITELTEELFYGMVGDYFSAESRIKEIDNLIKELKESEKNLPKLDAFETFSEYLAAAHAHQSFHELTDPPLERLREEKETVEKRKQVLSERLKELLPANVWLRYGGSGIRATKCLREDINILYTSAEYWASLSESWMELETQPWEKIRPIPKTITRTKKKGEKSDLERRLRKSYESGFLSDRHVFIKMPGFAVLGGILLFLSPMAVLWILPMGLALLSLSFYFPVRVLLECEW